MLAEKEYIKLSLESNLFFLRLAKEHAIFAAASLPAKDITIRSQLILFKDNFETLLNNSLTLSQGIISKEVLSSGELITDLTLDSENATQSLTAIPINTNITKREILLLGNMDFMPRIDLAARVSFLNHEAIRLTNAAIELKINLLSSILNCTAFSYTYPLMLDHVIRESKFYVMLLTKLENKDSIDSIEEIIRLEINWNRIMGEHSTFIRGYLDPSEAALFETANTFAKEFAELSSKSNNLTKDPSLLKEVSLESEKMVSNLRNFKRKGTDGILKCKVKAIMPPLLGDHVTREANHFLRLLRTFRALS